MSKLLKRFKTNKFLVSFSVLATGSVIAQIISILTSPITTRLFTPEQFGLYTIIATSISLFGPVICLKYDMAIVVAKGEKDTYTILKLSLFICIILSVIISILYSLLFIGNNPKGLGLYNYMIAIAFLLILYGINNILLAHNNRNALYNLISSVTIIKSAFNNVLLIISGILNTGITGIVCSQIISSFMGLGRQSKDVRKNLDKLKVIKFNQMKEMFIKYKNQPIFNASSALVTTSVYSSINLFIKSVYSVEQLGLYSLSYRVLGIPFTVISANFARIYFDSAAKESLESGKYSRTFKKTFIILAITIIPIIIIMAIISPWIFSFVFGNEWVLAGVYVRLLAPMFAIRLITESLTTSFIVSEKQNIELMFQASLFGGELIIYIICYLNKIDIELFLLLMSLLYLIIYGIMLIVMYNLSKENKNYVKN